VAFAGLIPHGIIEFPVLFLTAAIGMALGYHLLNRIRGRGSFRNELMRALNLFVMRITPLVVLAAIIEVTITPIIVALLML
jgi:stage II sporulation protein M